MANATYEESIATLGYDSLNWTVQVTVLFVLFIAGFIGNISVLYMLIRRKLVVSSTIRLLIFNLVVADLFVVNFCILTLAVWHYTVEWLAGDFLCRFSKFLQMFSLYASTFMVVVISVDRCIAVVAPMCRLGAKQYNRNMIMLAWMSAGIFSVPQAIIFKVARAPTEVVFYQCVTFGSYTQAWQEPLYTTFTLCVNFICPFFIIMVCYILILQKLSGDGFGRGIRKYAARHHLSALKETSSNQYPHWNESLTIRSKKFRKARTTSLILSILIVMTFITCWGPYYVRMLGSFIWEKATDEHVDNVVFFFGMSNSVINPFIYGAIHILGKSRRYSRSSIAEVQHHSLKMTQGRRMSPGSTVRCSISSGRKILL